MQRQRIQRVMTAGLALVTTAFFLAACGSSSGGSSSGSGSGSGSGLSGTLNGSGSTFQLTYLQAAIQNFKSVQSGITVNYGGGGSGKGRTDLAAGTVNYAASDSPIPPEEKSGFKGKTVLYFPNVIGPVTVSYNLPGVTSLKLTAPVIADIFQGKIKTWNDSAIKAINPGVKPAQHLDHHRPPLGLLRHHSELLELPRPGSAGRMEAWHRLDHQLAR